MDIQFTDRQLSRIIDQSLIFQCACPAQVAKQIIGLRDLHAYQRECLDATDTDRAVHARIAEDAVRAHAVLEECLRAVLILEKWNLETLDMPATLKKVPRVV